MNNNGSSEDFQLTDKGFLQLAHKYIYSDADTINVRNLKKNFFKF